MRETGLAVELLETRHVRDAFKAMPVKTDRNDARRYLDTQLAKPGDQRFTAHSPPWPRA
jgi:hypothetical protein